MSLGYTVVEGRASLGQKSHQVISNGGLVVAITYGNEELAATVAALLNGEATCQPKKPVAKLVRKTRKRKS